MKNTFITQLLVKGYLELTNRSFLHLGYPSNIVLVMSVTYKFNTATLADCQQTTRVSDSLPQIQCYIV